jgi:hypothetical protein
VFGNSGALRCTLSPDRSPLIFAYANELLSHWIVALTLEVNRDGTWNGFASPALSVSRAMLSSRPPRMRVAPLPTPIARYYFRPSSPRPRLATPRQRTARKCN